MLQRKVDHALQGHSKAATPHPDCEVCRLQGQYADLEKEEKPMGVYDTLVLPGTQADGEQVKCWFNQMRNIRVGDEVAPIITVRLREDENGIELLDEDYVETYHRDYVIMMRTGGCLVVRDCKLQGYFGEAASVPGEPTVGSMSMFDKWGEPWVSSQVNCGILGEPYFYLDANIARTINSLARARPAPVTDHDARDA